MKRPNCKHCSTPILATGFVIVFGDRVPLCAWHGIIQVMRGECFEFYPKDYDQRDTNSVLRLPPMLRH